ncbi:MAG: hypothetical protein IKE14_11640 [Loktanella sp.]|nr:hypothetical protein [Loktanella sp.]
MSITPEAARFCAAEVLRNTTSVADRCGGDFRGSLDNTRPPFFLVPDHDFGGIWASPDHDNAAKRRAADHYEKRGQFKIPKYLDIVIWLANVHGRAAVSPVVSTARKPPSQPGRSFRA